MMFIGMSLSKKTPDFIAFTEAILKAGIAPKQGADAIYYLEELRKHYAAIPDESERAQRATADLGRRLLDLLPIVLNDKESFSEMIAELERGGAVMKGPTVDALLDLHKEIIKHERAWEEVKNKAKEYAGEITLAFLKAVESITDTNAVLDKQGKILTDNMGVPLQKNPYWNVHSTAPVDTGGPFAGPQLPALTTTDLETRSKQIAAADALAAGTRKELIDLTVKLNELEKAYTEEKKTQNSLTAYDPKKIASLAQQVWNTKQLIDAQKDLLKQQDDFEKRFKEFQQGKNNDPSKALAENMGELYKIGQEGQAEALKNWLKQMEEADKKRLENEKAYMDFETALGKVITTSKLEQLKTEEQITATIMPRNDAERELIEVQKVHLQAAIQAEEVRVKFAQIRVDLEAKIQAMDPKSDQYRFAQEDIKQLDEALDKALAEVTGRESANVLRVHQQQYNKMIQSIRDGAGQVFDAIVARGKGAFQSMLDWIFGAFED